MTHDTLNKKSYKIPDLQLARNPNAWHPAPLDDLYHDPLLDPIASEAQREGWGEAEVSDPNYFAAANEEEAVLDEEETHYGARLGSLAVGLDKGVNDEDEDTDIEPSDDEHDHEEIEGKHDQAQ